jgi:hypothetical protein
MPIEKSELLQGTLDMLILKIVALGPVHGYGISQRIRQVSKEVLCAARIALSRAPSPRKARLARCGMGRVQQRPPGEVLQTFGQRPQAISQ